MHLFQRYTIASFLGLLTLGLLLPLKSAQAQGELQTEVAPKPNSTKIAFLVKDDRMLRSSVMSAVQMLEGKGYLANKATVVVIGPALKLLEKGSDAESQMKQAMQKGLQIDACEVAMKHMDIKADQLIDGVKPVDSGFFEIFRLQKQGYQTLTL
jgi:uncharacterized protein